MDPADTEAFRRVISHQQAQLGQHDQALQEITSSLRELSLTITSQPPVTPEQPAPVPSHSASPWKPFIPAPERYDGDLGLCRSFLLQCSLVFELQPQTYPTDKARIAVWERGSAVCSEYSTFTEEMRRVFDHPVRGREASQRLILLRQGSRSVASFIVEFWTLSVESGWNEEALQGVFLNALGGDVKDELRGVLGSRAPDRSCHSVAACRHWSSFSQHTCLQSAISIPYFSRGSSISRRQFVV
ncbi:Retrotransposon-derived protein PEG10 [Merluccius polli]|uniref:Retrotransposon-derived protein PEG10 n=1 Tax=Merluccius polli TaxID=89951 RepID=A0AA47MCU6_MERPO|nr:Retrotransposon-derived protein PEG10 [Merluccius polli]